MSIYATYWVLRFPRYGIFHTGCDWIDVYGQAVPDHCGPDAPGAADPFGYFLPPFETSVCRDIRAMVVVCDATKKVGQEYLDSLLLMSGRTYFETPFDELTTRISDALRGGRPRLLTEFTLADGTSKVVFTDGSAILVPRARECDDCSAADK